MSIGHGPALYVEAPSPIHRMAAHVKVVAALGFVAAVVSVPAGQVWAFAVLAVVLVAVGRTARVPLLGVVRRWALAAPFLALVPLLAVVAEGEQIAVGPLGVSRPGLWAAWNVGAKALLGLSTSVLLVATTRTSDLITGLDRLRVPPVFTTTAGFMLRYLQTTLDDARRLRMARLARGDDPRWLWQATGVAATAGTLFVRTYERGERVHRAMLARGYAGRLPPMAGPPPGLRGWAAGAALPAIAAVVALVAHMAQP